MEQGNLNFVIDLGDLWPIALWQIEFHEFFRQPFAEICRFFARLFDYFPTIFDFFFPTKSFEEIRIFFSALIDDFFFQKLSLECVGPSISGPIKGYNHMFSQFLNEMRCFFPRSFDKILHFLRRPINEIYDFLPRPTDDVRALFPWLTDKIREFSLQTFDEICNFFSRDSLTKFTIFSQVIDKICKFL